MTKYNSLDDFLKEIKKIQIDANVKNNDIALKIGKTKQTVSNVLNGRQDSIALIELVRYVDACGYDLYFDFVPRAKTDHVEQK